MRILACLVVLSLFMVFRFHFADGFTFPSILDDTRLVGMMFSTPTSYGWVSDPDNHQVSFSLLRPTKPSNSFLEILSKLEKHVLEAQASGNRANLNSLTKNIKMASMQRSYLFAREALGQALYRSMSGRSGIPKRSGFDGGSYLIKLKKEIGKDKLSKLLGVEDDKTLMFVIDDTGSMGGEINAVKKIAKAIVRTQAGKKTVNYILSVFNDPTTGPVNFTESGAEFIKKIEKLRANGGGDYPELTFTGMLAAMDKGPNDGSPMYVFTDATSKDHNKGNKLQRLIDEANTLNININFFTTSTASSFAPFVKVARETCGMILRLVGPREIRKLESITKLTLRNSGVCVSDGTGGDFWGKKRAVPRNKVILVDDSVKKMIISISTQNSNPIIVLRNPSGRRFTGRKISLYRAAIYELINPTPGRWTLSVAASAGKYHYLVRGSSDSNIDFDYYFVMVPKRRGRNIIPINQPLAGQRANAIITVAGAEKIQRNSLSLELIDSRNGRVLKTVAMTPRRRSKENAHFLVSFTPPSTPFKLRMKGRTKAGNSFERSSRKTIRATTALIRVYKAKDGQLTIPRGRHMYVILLIFNVGPTETFDVVVNDPKHYATTRRKRRLKVYRNRSRGFTLRFRAPSSAIPGKGYPVAVTIKGRTSRVETGQILNFIVV